jgi:hypothetical protein
VNKKGYHLRKIVCAFTACCFSRIVFPSCSFKLVFLAAGVTFRSNFCVEVDGSLVQHGQNVKISEALFGVVSGALHITRAFAL